MKSLRRIGASLLFAASFQSATAADAVTVEIRKFAFAPKELTIPVGTTVRWFNRDETPHTVTSSGGAKTLSSKAIDTDDNFNFTFKSPGDFAYLCTMHPFMTGVVHVTRK